MKIFIARFFLAVALMVAVQLFRLLHRNDSAKKVAQIIGTSWIKLETGYYGISLDKAYDFLKDRKSKTVVVAVIDSGVDTLQEDLKPILWHNPGEIPGNGIDDDHNGYVDDVYGWNFIGGKDGRMFTRILMKLQEFIGN